MQYKNECGMTVSRTLLGLPLESEGPIYEKCVRCGGIFSSARQREAHIREAGGNHNVFNYVWPDGTLVLNKKGRPIGSVVLFK